MEKLQLKGKGLIIGPHPDDETIFTGGLLLSFPGQIEVICLTDGRFGGEDGEEKETIRIRRKEFHTAMHMAGVKEFQMVGVEDGSLSRMESLQIDLSKYGTIFVPAPWDAHEDHAAVWGFIKNKILPHQEVYFYDGWSALAKPTHYLDISKVMGRKMEIIQAAYKSQLKYVDYDRRSEALAHYRGLLPYPAVEYAEAYQRVK